MSEALHEGFKAWGDYAGGPFMQKNGPARERGEAACNIKVCLVATDLPYLIQVLRELVERHDCFAVKYTTGDRDGMYLGRCFLTDGEAVGRVAQELKGDPKLMATCQDDDFFQAFRAPTKPPAE